MTSPTYHAEAFQLQQTASTVFYWNQERKEVQGKPDPSDPGLCGEECPSSLPGPLKRPQENHSKGKLATQKCRQPSSPSQTRTTKSERTCFCPFTCPSFPLEFLDRKQLWSPNSSWIFYRDGARKKGQNVIKGTNTQWWKWQLTRSTLALFYET